MPSQGTTPANPDQKPQYGFYAAMIPAVIAALFGCSWRLVSGSTTAISIAVFSAPALSARQAASDSAGSRCAAKVGKRPYQ